MIIDIENMYEEKPFKNTGGSEIPVIKQANSYIFNQNEITKQAFNYV